MALSETLAVIDERTVVADELLEQVARTALVGRSTENALEHLSQIISQAVGIIPDSDFERVRMVKAGEGTPTTSNLIKGIILEKRLSLDRMPRKLSASKVSVLSCPLELEQSTVTAEIEISTPEQYEAFIEAEQKNIDEITNKAVSSGCPVTSETPITGMPASLNFLAVPPVETNSNPRESRPFANSIIPDLS